MDKEEIKANWLVLGMSLGILFAAAVLMSKHENQQIKEEAYRKRLKIALRPYVMAKKERNCLKRRALKLQTWHKWNTPDSLACQCAEYN